MSLQVMAEVWKRAPVAGSKLLMLLALADSANDDFQCWPSITHLAWKTRVSDRQAKRILDELERDFIIKVSPRFKDASRERTSNMYTITPDSWAIVESIGGVAHDTTVMTHTTPRDDVYDTTGDDAHDTLNHNLESSSTPKRKRARAKGENPKLTQTELMEQSFRTEYAQYAPIADALRAPFTTLQLPSENTPRAALVDYLDAAKQLAGCNATADEIPHLYTYVKKRAARERWSNPFGVNALVKYYPDFKAQQNRRPAPVIETVEFVPVLEARARELAALESEGQS